MRCEEQMRHWPEWQDVGIKINDLREIRKTKDMEFCYRGSEIGSTYRRPGISSCKEAETGTLLSVERSYWFT
jgi:hypothetical protein